ncbi:M1 family metallopeptidase [Rubrolithibacter danxiaensis]|uniref:M1 family metallopeptidase n=1 Tax=Rubrolithibacter danxiaensis TaxID=3390805 RepID=UPI003BF8A974
MKQVLCLFISLFLLSCNQKKSGNTAETVKSQNLVPHDAHSFAEPEKAVVKHLDLTLNVDFNNHLLTGKATWTIDNPTGSDEIIFDTRQLNIQKVTLDGEKEETMFALGDEIKFLGKPLSIQIKPETKKITICYTTEKDAAALQWLNPEQTAGKKTPFLFTQSEAILARTWIPCQDSPGIRFTYNANVTVPKNLLALMSAKNPQQKNDKGTYKFSQPHAIPSYLMALAVGDIAFQAIDNRTGIYAEPVMLQKAAWEFADMGKMVDAAEKLYGPYKWGRYDVLVLPPSFPFGGMENPMLTFATPTVIAGDRSLVSLIAHELAHSWSGNLVTNATWNDFWLNEGFTTYIERRIVEAVYGREEAKMQEVLGYQSLKDVINELGPKNHDTSLKGNFDGRDPDEGMTDIPYVKGYFFLRTIERFVGREKFDQFLKEYFQEHAFHSVSTEQFLNDLDSKLLKSNRTLTGKINAKAWVYEPGMPSNLSPVSSLAFTEIDSLLTSYKQTKSLTGLNEKIKSTNEKLYFISHLPEHLATTDMAALDKEFNFTQSGNAEIQSAWYVTAIKNNYKTAYPYIKQFLISVGRRKFLVPIYKELVKTPEGKAWAREVYSVAEPNYHSVASNTIDQILYLDKK